jgi:hypothetical protein
MSTKEEKQIKKCQNKGKDYNEKTGRCIKKKITKDCPEGKVINPETGRCVKGKKKKEKLVLKRTVSNEKETSVEPVIPIEPETIEQVETEQVIPEIVMPIEPEKKIIKKPAKSKKIREKLILKERT